eukprot:102623_1
MSSILNKSIGRQDPKQFDDNDNNDSDNDYGQSAHTIGTDNAPSFVFRPFPKDIVGAVYRLQTIKNLLFVATFEALYIYRWNDILDAIGAVHTSSNHTTRLSIEAMHRYIAPQIEYEHGAKSRYVEVNALAHHGGRDSLFLGTGHCAIFELNLAKLELISRLNEHSDYVLDLSINNNHNVLSSASNDGTVKLWDVKQASSGTPSIASLNDNTSGCYANSCELHANGRYMVSALSGTKKKVCLFELRMKSLITEFDHNYIPQVVRFSNAWRPSNQSNLSICAGFNNSNLYLLDAQYSAQNKLMHSPCTTQTSSKSIWSIKTSQNIAFVCGTSNRVDLIANTANTITSLSAVCVPPAT